MRDSFPFLTRLGLRPDADAKDIRRAYARELKKIDQEADPAGFQELREAYEVALRWQAYEQQQQQAAEQIAQDYSPAAETATAPTAALDPAPAADPAPAPASAPPLAPVPEDPYELADHAFQKFESSMAMLVQRNDARHQTLWRTVLQRSLDDDRLLNLTARTIFEARIAHLLASGWRPGHETLFVVASEVFDWVRDSRRILQFGKAGDRMNRAIDEWKLFDTLSPHAVSTFKQLLQFVRATPKPQGNAGRNDLMLFNQLAGRFYSWLAVTLDRETLQNWYEAAQAEAERGPGEAQLPDPHPEPVRKRSIWSRPIIAWPIAFLSISLLIVLLALFNESQRPKGFYPPGDQPGAQRAAPQVDTDAPPSQERIDEIGKRIDYKWPANTPPGKYSVTYEVFIDADGVVLGMNRVSASSGDKGYDAAVQKAIKESKPFPPGTKTRFQLRYGVTFDKPVEPKGKPATMAQLRAVQEEIFYVPGGDVKPGVLKVMYELELNDQGKVIRLEKIKPSRDPAYDEVVADALKATSAFPPGTRRRFSVEYSRTIGER